MEGTKCVHPTLLYIHSILPLSPLLSPLPLSLLPPSPLSTCFPSPAPLPVGLSVSVLSLSSSLGECIEGMLGEIRLSHGSEIEDESG